MKTTPTITLTRPNGEARTLVVEVIDAVEARGSGARVRIVPPSGEAHDLVVREGFVEVCTKICRATLRRAEVRQPDGTWFEVPIPHIGAGDVYRLFEADGRPVDLGVVWRATRGAYPDPDGRWVVEGQVVERPVSSSEIRREIIARFAMAASEADVDRVVEAYLRCGDPARLGVQRFATADAFIDELERIRQNVPKAEWEQRGPRTITIGGFQHTPEEIERFVRELRTSRDARPGEIALERTSTLGCDGCAHDFGAAGCGLINRRPNSDAGGRAWTWVQVSTDDTGRAPRACAPGCPVRISATEPCAHCHVQYPAPVGHHHTEEECSANCAGWTRAAPLGEEQAMLARAREQGAHARRAGEPRDPTPDGQGRAWAEGWDEADAAVRAQAREQGAMERRAGTNRGYAVARVAGWVLPLGLDESTKEWRAGWDAEEARLRAAPTQCAPGGCDPADHARGEHTPAKPARTYAFLVSDLAATFGDRLTRVERGPRRFHGLVTPERDLDNHLDIDVTDLTDAERGAIVSMVGRVPVAGGRWEVLFNSHTAKSWIQQVRAPDARRGADGGIPVTPGDPFARAGTQPTQGAGAGEPAPKARPA